MEVTNRARKKNSEDLQFYTLLKIIVIKVVYFLLGVLISRGTVLNGLSPFGPAYAAAVPPKHTGTAVLGSMLGYILLSPSDAFRYIAVVVAIGSLKWLLSDFEKIAESRFFAPVLTFIPMLATGVVMLYVSTDRISEFGVCVVETVIASAAAYFISRSTQLMASCRGLTGFSAQEIACLTVSVCILMLSFGSVTFFNISLGRLMAVVAVLMCAGYSGVSGGSISGIATGVMFSLGTPEMSFLAGGYAFGGLVGGIFSLVGRLPVGAAFTLCNTVISLVSAEKEMAGTLFIECLLGTGIFMIIPGDFGNTVRSAFSPTPDRNQSEAMRRGVVTRLDHAAYALEGVTDCINAVAEKLGKRICEDADLEIFEDAVNSTCSVCGLKVYCWQKQRELTKDDFRKLGRILREEGFVNEKNISDNFVKKCCKQRELAGSINEGYREYLSTLAAQRRISQVRSVVADQFSSLSDMLWDLSEEFSCCENFDIDSARRITERLREAGLVIIDCACRIDRGKGMTVELEIALSKNNEPDLTEIRHIVSRCCGRRFDCVQESAVSGRVRLTMSEVSCYDVEIGTSQHIAGGGNLCGDCIDYFLNGMGSMVAIISDGMGSGGAAAVDSNMAVSVLTRLLKAGLSYDCALSVVNSSLMIKSEDESMATLDVADINLFTGKVNLLKAGSPVTFVRKGGRVHRREFPSLPVGILGEVKFAKESVTLHEGDALVMVSDGMLLGDDEWLIKLIRDWQEAPAQDFASVVVNEAMKRRKDTHDDDITAIAIKLIEN